MSGIVRVHSIESLDEFRGEIKRFAWQTQEMLQSIEQELNRTKIFLHEQINHWRNQEERYKEEVFNVSIALERCQDEEDQDCNHEEELLAQAKWHLTQIQIELQETKKRLISFEKVEQDYMRQVIRLKRMMNDDIQKGIILLNSLVTKLNDCVENSN